MILLNFTHFQSKNHDFRYQNQIDHLFTLTFFIIENLENGLDINTWTQEELVSVSY